MQKNTLLQPRGPTDGPIRLRIFARQSARLYNLDQRADLGKPEPLHLQRPII